MAGSTVDFTYVEIGSFIRVYKNLLPENSLLRWSLDKMVDANSSDYLYSEWEDWFVFGKYSHEKHNLTGETLKVDATLNGELGLHRAINDATKMAMAHYVGDYKIPLPEKSFMTNVSLAFYNDGVDISSDGTNMAMNFHSDYVFPSHGWPGEKFLITVTTYINDDYEGGEIVFLHENTLLTYKPQAGDIIVFPSGNPTWPQNSPYLHHVKTPLNGRKYILRSFLKYIDDSASQEWIDGVNLHGEEEYKRMCMADKNKQSILNDGRAPLTMVELYDLPSHQIITSDTTRTTWVHSEE
jgi:hypothetical protein